MVWMVTPVQSVFRCRVHRWREPPPRLSGMSSLEGGMCSDNGCKAMLPVVMSKGTCLQVVLLLSLFVCCLSVLQAAVNPKGFVWDAAPSNMSPGETPGLACSLHDLSCRISCAAGCIMLLDDGKHAARIPPPLLSIMSLRFPCGLLSTTNYCCESL